MPKKRSSVKPAYYVRKEQSYKLSINCIKHQKAIIVRHFAVKCRGIIEHDVAENFNAWV